MRGRKTNSVASHNCPRVGAKPTTKRFGVQSQFMNSSPNNTSRKLLSDIRNAALRSLPNALAIYVYGSVARNDEHANSDIDIAVLLRPKAQITDLLGTIGGLASELHRDVNLINLRNAGNILRKEVLTDGVLLYAQDADALLGWEAEAMSEYAEHRYRIRDIIRQVSDTGIAYAK